MAADSLPGLSTLFKNRNAYDKHPELVQRMAKKKTTAVTHPVVTLPKLLHIYKVNIY